MKKTTRILTMAMALTAAATGVAMATPSTQIWIPSTDIQGFNTYHLGIDNYTRTSSNGGGAAGSRPNIYDLGLTAGVLPFDKVQAEVGVDYITGYGSGFDGNPISFNAKLGTPEDSIFKYSPALAVGMYGVGTNSRKSSAYRTDANIIYGLAAKTLPVIGRLSAGYYGGNDDILVNLKNGKKDSDGVLLSWDRTMTEISDKLWVAVDYQGGKNAYGALSFGAAWNFSKNVSVIFGYDIYNEKASAGANTFTTQLDINFP